MPLAARLKMKFGPIPVLEVEGKILGHNVAGPDGRRALRKGRQLTTEDISKLVGLGRKAVYVAEIEPSDVDENTAAHKIAMAASGPNLRLSGPATGRVNLFAQTLGVLRVDESRLTGLNGCPGVTLATLRSHSAVQKGKMVGTVKILPYAVPADVLAAALNLINADGPLIDLTKLELRRVGLILSGSRSAGEGIVRGFEKALRLRLEALGSTISRVDFVPLEDVSGEDDLASAIRRQIDSGLDMLILAGETAIMDRHDIAPRAVENAGGEVTCYGAPVDPGNLLMLAYHGRVPIMGAPGCARSPKQNIVDLLLPRLLAGDQLSRTHIVELGHGGLMEDVPERPSPRSNLR